MQHPYRARGRSHRTGKRCRDDYRAPSAAASQLALRHRRAYLSVRLWLCLDTIFLLAFPQRCRAGLLSAECRSSFKKLLHRCIFLGMIRARLEPGQLQLAQPFADRALAHRDRKAPSNLVTQINTSPPHDLVHRRIWTSHDQFAQFLQLRLAQLGRGSRCWKRYQAIRAGFVVAMPLRRLSTCFARGTFGSSAQSRSVWRSIPACRAASSRLLPSRTMAIARRRRLCATSRVCAAKPRGLVGVIHPSDLYRSTQPPLRSGKRRTQSESHNSISSGIPQRVAARSGWY